jgi:hypothetical protein
MTCDGHRSDDDRPYVFASEEYGQSWRSLVANLPANCGSTRVIREDVENENVLYLGTEFAIWVSIDRGASWTRLNNNLPTVAIHEIAVHPTAGEIVAGTHGRSLWVLDVAGLRQVRSEAIEADVKLYQPQPAIQWRSRPGRGSSGTRRFVGETPSSGATVYYSLAEDANQASLRISDIEGNVVRELDADSKAGFHRINWNLRAERQERSGRRSRRGRVVSPGKYLLTLTVGDQEQTAVLSVLEDPTADD